MPQARQSADRINKILARNLGDGGERHRGLTTALKDQARARAQAVPQPLAGVVEFGLGQQRLAAGRHPGINRAQWSLSQWSVRGRIHQDHRLSQAQAGAIEGRHLHPGQEPVVADQAGERSAGLNHIPLFHLEIADAAADRGSQIAEGQIGTAGDQLLSG